MKFFYIITLFFFFNLSFAATFDVNEEEKKQMIDIFTESCLDSQIAMNTNKEFKVSRLYEYCNCAAEVVMSVPSSRDKFIAIGKDEMPISELSSLLKHAGSYCSKKLKF